MHPRGQAWRRKPRKQQVSTIEKSAAYFKLPYWILGDRCRKNAIHLRLGSEGECEARENHLFVGAIASGCSAVVTCLVVVDHPLEVLAEVPVKSDAHGACLAWIRQRIGERAGAACKCSLIEFDFLDPCHEFERPPGSLVKG